jgi:hypothetical protein
MKDTRFVELVNLYVDRQLSADEAAELELEIQSNPRRRQVYLQYCRMHRATKLVYESFRAHSEQQGDAPQRSAAMARLEHRQRRRSRWAYAGAGLAAAACLTFIFSRADFAVPADRAAEPQALTAAKTTPAAPAVAAAPTPIAESGARPAEARPALMDFRNSMLAEADYAAVLAAARQHEQRLLDLTRGGERVSLFDDGVFEERMPLRAAPAAPNRRSRAQTEFTAFQFQR